MAMQGKRDQNSDAPKYSVTDKNQTGQSLFGNTTVGVFGVDAVETSVTKAVAHQGWQLRKVGSGGRAGRVQIECLSVSTIQGDATSSSNTTTTTIANSTGSSDDTQFPDS